MKTATTRSYAPLLALVAMLWTPREIHADTVVYGVAGATLNSSVFGTLDLTTGQFTTTATLSPGVEAITSSPGGALYATGDDGHLYSIGSGGSMTQVGTVTAPVPPGDIQVGYFALAAGPDGFYTYSPFGFFPTDLDRIAKDGNSVSTVGSIDLLTPGSSIIAGTGTFAYGPDGTLYADFGSFVSGAQLYSINTITGVATPIGTGAGTPNFELLALVYAGGNLYGIVENGISGSSPIPIYTVDTTTGQWTPTGVDVHGLPIGYNFNAAASVPEPSTLSLMTVAGISLSLLSRYRRLRTRA